MYDISRELLIIHQKPGNTEPTALRPKNSVLAGSEAKERYLNIHLGSRSRRSLSSSSAIT